MEIKPQLKISLSQLDNKLELASKLLLVVLWLLTIYSFLKLPGTIPIHFNIAGQADNYGEKWTLVILPTLGTIIYVGLTYLSKYPHLYNYMTKITADNAEKQYTISTRMIRLLKTAILLIFSLIVLFTYLTTIGVSNGLGFWFLPVTVGLLLIPTIISISQSLKSKNKVA